MWQYVRHKPCIYKDIPYAHLYKIKSRSINYKEETHINSTSSIPAIPIILIWSISIPTMVPIIILQMTITPHITIQNPHKIRWKVSDRLPRNIRQLIHGKNRIMLTQHPKLLPHILIQIRLRTKIRIDHFLQGHLDDWRQIRSHHGGTRLPLLGIDVDVPFDDSHEVGRGIPDFVPFVPHGFVEFVEGGLHLARGELGHEVACFGGVCEDGWVHTGRQHDTSGEVEGHSLYMGVS